MTTTVATCLADARNYLMGSTHDTFNTLSGSLDALTTTTSVVLSATDSTLLPTVGSYIEIDLEVMYVTAVSSTTATVIRGFLGSTPASHTSGVVVRIDPTFFDFMLLRELNGELNDLSSPGNGLFKIAYVDLTYSASTTGYDLTSTTTVEDVLDVRFDSTGSQHEWPRAEFELMRSMPTTSFTSGNAIRITKGGFPGRTIRVFYRAPYTAVTATTDTLDATAGVHTEACDIPAIGVAIRVTAGREIMRNDYQSQGDSRRADEVPPGANNSAPAGLRQLRASRIASEVARLQARWPNQGRSM